MKINKNQLKEMIKGYVRESLINKTKLTESKSNKSKKIKLKDLLSESNVWDRKFGEPLPTLKQCAERYAKKKVNEEIIDWQGRYDENFKFKVGMMVRDINPDCPHHGSEGVITEITGKNIKYEVRNIGRVSDGVGSVKYEPGDILTKTKDQLYPLSQDSLNKDFKKVNLKK